MQNIVFTNVLEYVRFSHFSLRAVGGGEGRRGGGYGRRGNCWASAIRIFVTFYEDDNLAFHFIIFLLCGWHIGNIDKSTVKSKGEGSLHV
jgi:hypothetical protein